jgi:FtsH-binding integral membrane protein
VGVILLKGSIIKKAGVGMDIGQLRKLRKLDRLSGRVNSYAKIRYGYLTMLAAVVSFGACLITVGYFAYTSPLYVKALFNFTAALHGFVRTCLLIVVTIAPMWYCRSMAYKKPIISLIFYVLSLVVLGFPMGLVFLYVPIKTVFFAAAGTIGITFLFCTIGILTKKDLTNWGGFLSMALASLAMDSVLNLQFFHLSWLTYSISFGATMLFLGYLIYDANQAMHSYDEAKRLGGLYLVSILFANSLEILLDMIYLFWQNIGSDNNDHDDYNDNGFDSFW